MTDTRQGQPRESWSYSGEVWTDGDGRAVVALPAVRPHSPRRLRLRAHARRLALVGGRRGRDRGRHYQFRHRRAAREGHLARHRAQGETLMTSGLTLEHPPDVIGLLNRTSS